MSIALRIAIGSAFFLLAGCKSSPKTILLTLDAIAPPPAAVHADYRGPVIAIPNVHVPVMLDRTEFVHQVAAGSARIDDFAHWAAPLGLLTRDALVRDLIARLPEGTVLPPGATRADASTRILDVTILSFDTTPDGAAMQVAWRTLPSGQSRQASLRIDQPISAPSTSAQAYAALIAKLADRISEDVAKAGTDR